MCLPYARCGYTCFHLPQALDYEIAWVDLLEIDGEKVSVLDSRVLQGAGTASKL